MNKALVNRLKNANSIYLKQHSNHPVDWQPWDRQALDLALTYDKPILLSIGYSACHWCHVMADECFADPKIAQLMNANFINIKVDREERPDIDQIYMAALTAMGEQGGWPLTIFLTPQGDAFWGGTYFPKTSNGHLPGFNDVLTSIARLWQNDRQRITNNMQNLKQHLQTMLMAADNDHPNNPLLENINESPDLENSFQLYANSAAQRIDTVSGGISGAPKFPNFPLMSMLWVSWKLSGQQHHHDLLALTTEKMLNGGIYDHLAGGLARYSTDDLWLVPHFEKMLYDNAQTIRQATWLYGSTKNPLFRRRIEEIISWLVHEMALPDGGFASGLDADSDGEEGKFYLWQQAEITGLLQQDAQRFIEEYDITQTGHWEGQNILNRCHTRSFDVETDKILQPLREKLLKFRNQRPQPQRDDKCLTDWNGYTIRALAEAARLFQRQDWLQLAKSTYDKLFSQLKIKFSHCISDNRQFVPALSSDYAAFINAALSLYQADPNQIYIDDAYQILNELNQSHRDANGDYRLTSFNTDDVIFYLYGDQDEAIPSATSQIIEALMRLSLIAGDTALLNNTNQLAIRALQRSRQLAHGQASLLTSAVQLLDPVKLLLIIETIDDPLYHCACQHPDPMRTDIILTPAQATQQPQWAGLLSLSEKRSCAILCRHNVCLPPIYQARDLQKLL